MLRLYLYGVLSRLYFHLPILLVFLLLREVGLVAAEAMLAVYGLALTAGSSLSTRLPLRLSESRILGIGEIVKAAGVLLLAISAPGDLLGLFAGQIIAGLGFGCTVGRESVVLRRIVAPERVTAAQSRLQSCLFLSSFAAGVVGAIMYQLLPWLPFAASTASCLVAAAVVWTLDDEPRTAAPRERVQADPGSRRIAWMLYYIVTRAIGFALYLAVLPLLLRELGLSLWAFGLVLGVFTVAAYLSALYGNRLIDLVGERLVSAATMLSLLGSICLFAFLPTLPSVFTGIFLLGIGLGCARPVGLRNLALPKLPPPARSWILLTQERWYGVVNAALMVLAGLALALSDSDFTLVLSGLGVVYIVFVLVFARLLAASPKPAPRHLAERRQPRHVL